MPVLILRFVKPQGTSQNKTLFKNIISQLSRLSYAGPQMLNDSDETRCSPHGTPTIWGT